MTQLLARLAAVTERAERAEGALAEAQAILAKLLEQKPVAWMYADSWGTHFTEEKREVMESHGVEEVTELYAAHIPANQPQSGVLAVLAPSVPDEWRGVA